MYLSYNTGSAVAKQTFSIAHWRTYNKAFINWGCITIVISSVKTIIAASIIHFVFIAFIK